MKIHSLRVGPTEKRILKYLALNPDQFISHIENGLSKKYNKHYDRTAISKSVKKLNEEKKLIEIRDQKKTKKNVTWPVYGLTPIGRSYVMSLNDPDIPFLKIMENYNDDEMFSGLKQVFDVLSKHLKEKYINQLGTAIGKVGIDVWNSKATNIDEGMAIVGGMLQGWAFSKAVKSASFYKKWQKAQRELVQNPETKKFFGVVVADMQSKQDDIVVSKKMLDC